MGGRGTWSGNDAINSLAPPIIVLRARITATRWEEEC